VIFGSYLATRLNHLLSVKSHHANDAVAVVMDELVTSEWNVHVGGHQSTRVVAVGRDHHHYSKSRMNSSVGVYGTKTVAPKESLDFGRFSFSIASELELPMLERPFALVMDCKNLSESWVVYLNRCQMHGRDNPYRQGYDVFDSDEFRLHGR
jgi:hypothetical protein